MNDVEVVEKALKEYGEPIRLKDLMELTKGEIEWQTNPTSQMRRIVGASNLIIRPKYGQYAYQKPEQKQEIKLGPVFEIKEIKPRTGMVTKSIDEHIVEIKEEDKKLLMDFKSHTVPVKQKNKYKQGDTFTGRISGIEAYGAFIEDENLVSGLVHMTQIRKGQTVYDPTRYFKVGDIVEAKVKSINSKGISLTTFDSKLPDYFDTPMAEQLSTIVPVKEEPKVANEKKIERNFEFEQLVKHMQDVVGVVSEPAKDKLEELLSGSGLVNFMLSMMEAEKEFKVDLGLQFLSKIEDKMRNRL